MIALQLPLYCLLFTGMVRIAVIGGAVNGLYFYPKALQDGAIELGLTDRETMERKRKRFMTAFYLVMLAALALIIGVWNGVTGFWAAYRQALLFLEVMNVYDGIVIDKLWVGHSRFWVLPGLEEMPFVAGAAEEKRAGAYLDPGSGAGGRHRRFDFLRERNEVNGKHDL